MSKDKGEKLSIDQLQQLLTVYDDVPVEILPDGTIVVLGDLDKLTPKLLTRGQDLGSNY